MSFEVKERLKSISCLDLLLIKSGWQQAWKTFPQPFSQILECHTFLESREHVDSSHGNIFAHFQNLGNYSTFSAESPKNSQKQLLAIKLLFLSLVSSVIPFWKGIFMYISKMQKLLFTNLKDTIYPWFSMKKCLDKNSNIYFSQLVIAKPEPPYKRGISEVPPIKYSAAGKKDFGRYMFSKFI